jgi:hypothetical protein
VTPQATARQDEGFERVSAPGHRTPNHVVFLPTAAGLDDAFQLEHAILALLMNADLPHSYKAAEVTSHLAILARLREMGADLGVALSPRSGVVPVGTPRHGWSYRRAFATWGPV